MVTAVMALALVNLGWAIAVGLAVARMWNRMFSTPPVSPLDVSAIPLGHVFRKSFSRWPRGVPCRTGVYIIGASNCVGTHRMCKSIDAALAESNGTWIMLADQGSFQDGDGPRLGLVSHLAAGAVLRRRHAELRTPHAVYVGQDGRVWRRAVVATQSSWERFWSTCPERWKHEHGLTQAAEAMGRCADVNP